MHRATAQALPGEPSSPTPPQRRDFSPGTSDSPSLNLTPSLGDVAKGPTTEMAAVTPVPVSYSSALAPGPGSDSLARASCTTDMTQLSQAARPQASPVPSKVDDLTGEGPEAPTGFQQDSGPKHLTSSSVVWYHLDPAWERNLGWAGREERGKRPRNQNGKRDENQTTAYK